MYISWTTIKKIESNTKTKEILNIRDSNNVLEVPFSHTYIHYAERQCVILIMNLARVSN